MSGGYQILAQGNTLESNGIAIVVEAVEGVEISSNYFEANPDKSFAGGELVTLQPNSETSTAPPVAMHSDILLNGANSFHGGSSFFPHAQNPGWQYGRGYCPGSVTIRGNTHSPAANTSLIYAVCGSDIVIEGNSGDSFHKTRAGYHLLETGSDPELYLIKHLSVKGNVGFPSLFKLHEPSSSDPDKNGPVGAHSWVVEGARESYRRRNLLQSTPGPSTWPDLGSCNVSESKKQHDGVPTIIVTSHASCALTLLNLDLAEEPELQGQIVYFLAQVNMNGASGHHIASAPGFSMMVDTGNGVWRNSSATSTAAENTKLPGWAVHSFQATLGETGVARFGLGVAAAVELGVLVVARVGDDWSSMI